jgi:ribosomal protein S18 acetylase RimI-like enzyme
MAAALVRHVIEQASGIAEEILLTYTASNMAAAKLYSRFGFEPYGAELRAVRIEDCFHDIVLMRRRLSGSG